VDDASIGLLERFLDDSLEAAEASELLRKLDADPEFRREVASALRMQGLLRARLDPDASCERLAEVVAIAIKSGERSFDSRVMEEIKARGLTRPRRREWIAAAAAAVLLARAVWIARSRSAPTRRLETASAPGTIRSIAVLPLDNYSGDPSQDYFAEGMTDELTSDLANISQLRVISRGSVMQFKGAHRPPTPEIAKILDVEAIVEGSVLRFGDKV